MSAAVSKNSLAVRAKNKFIKLRAEEGLATALLYVVRASWMRMQIMVMSGPVRIAVWSERRSHRKTLRLAFAVSGGVGDFIVVARFIRDLLDGMPEPVLFDVYGTPPSRSRWLYAGIPGFKKERKWNMLKWTMSAYDVVFLANQSIKVIHDSLKDRTDSPAKLNAILRQIELSNTAIIQEVANHPYMDNLLARKAVATASTRRNFLHSMAGIPYGGDKFGVPMNADAPEKLGLRPQSYVTVHNGFDADFDMDAPVSTKCYPHFDDVVRILREHHPHVVFVQVGVKETSRVIPHCHRNLIGQTSLRDVSAVLAHAAFHIDNEGGLVHLAACFGTPSAVVFGPTPSDYYAYPGNLSIDPAFCGNCWWMTRDWMAECPKGYGQPRCLMEQDPRDVAKKIIESSQWTNAIRTL